MNIPDSNINREQFSGIAVEAAIKIALMFAMMIWCFEIIRPFIHLVVWGAIIAIALFPLTKVLSEKLTLSIGKSSALVTVIALILLIVPTVLFSGAIISGTQEFANKIVEGNLVFPPPKASVNDWPIIGERLFSLWSQASSNLQLLLENHSEELKTFMSHAANILGGLTTTILQFIFSIIISGLLMANAQSCGRVFHHIAVRIAGSHGEEFSSLTVATVRGVVQGVIGVAIIQSILAGLGMALVGIPATGIWMLLVLILAIVQLPPIIILAPIIAYVFSVESSTVAIVFTIWCIIVSGSDAILKPILMGRGVDLPMLVILLGAIGGMVMSGIIGLFSGAVVLALGYKLFMAWLKINVAEKADSEVPTEAN